MQDSLHIDMTPGRHRIMAGTSSPRLAISKQRPRPRGNSRAQKPTHLSVYRMDIGQWTQTAEFNGVLTLKIYHCRGQIVFERVSFIAKIRGFFVTRCADFLYDVNSWTEAENGKSNTISRRSIRSIFIDILLGCQP